MKTVFGNSAMVAHIWAQRRQDNGRSSSGSLFFNSDAIYSYGHHFPIAKFIENKKGEVAVLFNNTNYSVTTSKHQSEVMQALPNHYKYILTGTEILKEVCYIGSFLKRGEKQHHKRLANGVNNYVSQRLVYAAETAAKRRKPELVDRDLNTGLAYYNDGVALLQFYGIKIPKAMTALKLKIETDYKAVSSEHAAQIAKAKRKADKLAKERAAKQLLDAQEKAYMWRAGEDVPSHVLYHLPNTMLRIKGDVIQTSQGAEFPVDQAIVAFSKIKQVLNSKVIGLYGKIEFTEDNKPRLGNFKIDIIEANGNVKAGCHYVKYDEIEAIAKQLNLEV